MPQEAGATLRRGTFTTGCQAQKLDDAYLGRPHAERADPRGPAFLGLMIVALPLQPLISPLLANIYLHYVLDEWFAKEVQPRMKGRSFLIRYADDFVMGFTCEEDARRVMAVLPKRFGKYGLRIHPEKTRLVPFRKPADPNRYGDPGDGGPGTFERLRDALPTAAAAVVRIG